MWLILASTGTGIGTSKWMLLAPATNAAPATALAPLAPAPAGFNRVHLSPPAAAGTLATIPSPTSPSLHRRQPSGTAACDLWLPGRQPNPPGQWTREV